ncbi:MAG: ubiquinol-cytochrome c reductase iron-sulfur subunit, partial [Terriglobia bacterium]
MTEDSGEPQSGNLPVYSPDASTEPGEISRRRTLGWLFGAGGAVVAGLLSIPLIRMAFYPLFAKSGTEAWSNVGSVSGYASLHTPARRVIQIQTTDGWQRSTSEKIVYVTKNAEGSLVALSAVCPHLGCEISWSDKTDQFFCPCHG